MIEATAPDLNAVQLAEESVGTQLLKALVQEIQHLQKPWQNMPAAQQQHVLDRLTNAVRENVQKAVKMIASQGHTCMNASVESVTFKDGVKAVLKLPRGNVDNHELAESTDRQVLIVIMNAEQHTDGMHVVKPDPDQKDLLNEGSRIQSADLADLKEEDRLYVTAVQFARAMGWVSIAALESKLEVSKEVCGEIVDRMHANGLLGESNTDGSWPVLKSPGDAK